jgi:hypothetical protein
VDQRLVAASAKEMTMDDENRAEFVRRLRALADDVEAQRCDVRYDLKCDPGVRSEIPYPGELHPKRVVERGREEWKIEVRYR